MAPASPRPEPRVLVADGCSHARRYVREVLQAAGLRRIYDAADGAEALGLLEAASPTLLVVDWDLRVIGAPDLIQMARGAGKATSPPIPIVVLMTEPRRSAVERAIEIGAGSIVAKPCSARLLRSRVAMVLDAQAA